MSRPRGAPALECVGNKNRAEETGWIGNCRRKHKKYGRRNVDKTGSPLPSLALGGAVYLAGSACFAVEAPAPVFPFAIRVPIDGMRLTFCSNRGAGTAGKFYKLTSSTRLTSLTWAPARSSSTGIRSISSLSCASENQLEIGRACCGWNMYEVGELSIMMVFRRSLPT
jgi:hypothetical protein